VLLIIDSTNCGLKDVERVVEILKSCTQVKINSWKEDDHHHIGYKLKFFEKKTPKYIGIVFWGKVSPNDDYFSSNWRNF